jgi:alpha-1,2-mannosyltransferase
VKVFFAVAAVIFCFAVVGAKSDYAFEICAVTVLLVVTAVSGVVWVHYGLLAIVPIAGAIILHRSWSAAATCMLLFAPFGAVFVSEERTPLSMPWATVAALLFPVILLIVQELRGKNITWSSVVEGVKGEFIG